MGALFNNPVLFGEDILNSLHIFAGGWLDSVMLVITSAGSNMFYMLALPVLYWCWDRKKAVYTGAVFLIGIAVNDYLKTVFDNPRPDPAKLLPGIAELATRYRPHGPGFPSGHTQGAILLWGSIALQSGSRTVKAVCAGMIILIPYSRLYLGVHYLGDVVGGFILGAACFALIYPSAKLAERYYHMAHTILLSGLLILIPFIISLLVPGKYISTTMGTISGFMIGALLAEDRIRFNPRNGLAATAAKIAIGLSVVFVIGFGLKTTLQDIPESDFFRYWLIGFWCSFVAPLIFSKIALLRGDVVSE